MIISVHREAATAIFINPTAKLLPDLTQSLPGQNHPAQVQTVHLDIQTLIRKVPAATAAARQGHPAVHILAANQKTPAVRKRAVITTATMMAMTMSIWTVIMIMTDMTEIPTMRTE